MHEASLYTENCFITLTYNSKNLPNGSTLVLSHFQNFMKYLRKEFGPGIRFFHCGEYGEKKTLRPHYHCLLFNFNFPDKILYSDGPPKGPFSTFKDKSFKTYTSETLTRLWGKGRCDIGSLTFESAAYVARYCMKKITNKKTRWDTNGKYWPSAAVHYGGRKPEYITMSRNPGIGKTWFDEFHSEVYPDDAIPVRGKLVRPPKSYDTILEKNNKSLFDQVKEKRRKNTLLRPILYQDDLDTMQTIKIASMRQSTRSIE